MRATYEAGLSSWDTSRPRRTKDACLSASLTETYRATVMVPCLWLDVRMKIRPMSWFTATTGLQDKYGRRLEQVKTTRLTVSLPPDPPYATTIP